MNVKMTTEQRKAKKQYNQIHWVILNARSNRLEAKNFENFCSKKDSGITSLNKLQEEIDGYTKIIDDGIIKLTELNTKYQLMSKEDFDWDIKDLLSY